MGRLITTEFPSTTKEEKTSQKIVKRLARVASTAQVIEYLDISTDLTKAESSAREMINSNKYVVIDNTSLKSMSKGLMTPSHNSQGAINLIDQSLKKMSLVHDPSNTEFTTSKLNKMQNSKMSPKISLPKVQSE